jgi:hypothetical protein
MNRTSIYLGLSLLLVSAASLNAKDKHPKKQVAAQQDEIEVTAHLPLTGGPVTRFVETRHYRRDYLYAEHDNKTVTLIDVTTITAPTQLAEMALPAGRTGNLVSVNGTAALVGGAARSEQSSPAPQTFRIMSFTDPLHPTVKQEFEGVTAMAQDDKRGLIFLANDAGVWILRQHYAVSPEDEAFQKEIEHTIYDTR